MSQASTLAAPPLAPPWLCEAYRHIGTREVPGPQHEFKILQWWKAIKRGGIKDDETPWCAAFVGGCLEEAGITSTRFESARSYEAWGHPLAEPAVGCIVVFSRVGGGHVGFVVGQDATGNLLVLGGNQGNAVNVRAFPRSRATAYRWPSQRVVNGPLPVLAAADMSTTEA